MIKDRLADIESQRAKPSKKDGKEKKKLLGDEDRKKVDNYLKLSKRMGVDMENLDTDIKEIHDLHSRILSQPPSPALTKELNARTNEIHVKIKQMKDEVMVINGEVASSFDNKNSAVDNRILNEQARRLTRKLLKLRDKFEQEQTEYKEKSKKKYMEYLRVVGTNLPEEELEDALQNGTLSEKIRGVMLAHDEKRALLNDVMQRTDGILSIEKSIRELSEMFHDLLMLVVSQDDMLENIAKNVERSVDYAQNGKKELKNAIKLKRRAQRLKFLLIGGIIVLVIIVVSVGFPAICFYLPFC